jgi:hypothetical protein
MALTEHLRRRHRRIYASYGYYARGVDERTAILPRGWRDRLVAVSNENTNGVVGLCLEVNDLAISKYVAGRSKDFKFPKELAKHSMTSLETPMARVDNTDVTSELRDIMRARIRRDFSRLSSR